MKRLLIRLITAFIPSEKRQKKHCRRCILSVPNQTPQIAKIRAAQEWSLEASAIPKAQGLAQVVQILVSDISSVIDRICSLHNLRYRQNYGTLYSERHSTKYSYRRMALLAVSLNGASTDIS